MLENIRKLLIQTRNTPSEEIKKDFSFYAAS